MSSVAIPAASTSLVEAINFLTYPLSLTLPHLTVNSLQQVLLSTLTTVPAWLRDGRLILTISSSAPPRPIFAACIATQLDWSHWYYVLGGREFDLVVEQTAVSVWVAGISGHAEVWKQASDPYPPFLPSITTFSPKPHVPITRFGRPSRLNKATPSLVQPQTVAQQLLQSDHEKEEADEIFAMISSLDACLITPTPTHERFTLPNASIAKAPALSRLAPLPALDEEVFHSRTSLRQPMFTRDHVFSPISSPELSLPNSPYSSNSYSSSRESLTSISSTQSSVCSPLEASAKPFVQASKIATLAPRSSSIPPAQAPKSQVQRYLYQGGQSTVLTGGVMLGATGKAPISRTPPTVGYKSRSSGGKGKKFSTGTQTQLPVGSWRRAPPTRI